MKIQTPSISNPVIHPDAQSAWRSALSTLLSEGERVEGVTDPLSVGSGFGKLPRSTTELVATSFAISGVRRRLIKSEAYTPGLAYSIALTIWTLGGSDDLEMISFYNSRGRSFTDDGRTVPSAPGRRIFRSAAGDQFAAVVERLRLDASSRRGMIQLYLPEDAVNRSRDSSCLGSVQIIRRSRKLMCIATLRSQSTAMVMPYDVFLLTMLHEALSVELGLELGTYYQFNGSLHFYEDEEALVSRIVSQAHFQTSAMAPMTSCNSTVRARLVAAEADLRTRLSVDAEGPIPFDSYDLDDYWTGLLRAMVVDVRRRLNANVREEELALVPATFVDHLRAK